MIRILLVEDDLVNQAVVQDIIEFDCPFATLHSLPCAEEAIEWAKAERPDLILMDLGLPGMDGLDATAHLRGLPETSDIPVWALTAHAMKGFEQTACGVGCDAYITKPIETLDMVERLSNFNRNPVRHRPPATRPNSRPAFEL